MGLILVERTHDTIGSWAYKSGEAIKINKQNYNKTIHIAKKIKTDVPIQGVSVCIDKWDRIQNSLAHLNEQVIV